MEESVFSPIILPSFSLEGSDYDAGFIIWNPIASQRLDSGFFRPQTPKGIF
jgi:hypothetical protein